MHARAVPGSTAYVRSRSSSPAKKTNSASGVGAETRLGRADRGCRCLGWCDLAEAVPSCVECSGVPQGDHRGSHASDGGSVVSWVVVYGDAQRGKPAWGNIALGHLLDSLRRIRHLALRHPRYPKTPSPTTQGARPMHRLWLRPDGQRDRAVFRVREADQGRGRDGGRVVTLGIGRPSILLAEC